MSQAIDRPVERRPGGPRISYAQNLEDILLDRVLGDRRGLYLDIGANHPYLDSNTYFFYLRGWRGVCIEPTASGHRLLCEQRPDDIHLQVAASDQEGELTLFEVERQGHQTGLSTSEVATAREHAAQGFAVLERKVPARTIASIVAEHRLPPADLVSIDVEGHERAVLRGMPLATWRPAVFVIESTVPLDAEPTYRAWEPILLEHGYRFATFNGVNRFYVRADLADWIERLQIPVNYHDQFLRHDLVATQTRCDELQARYEAERAARAHDLAQFGQRQHDWQQSLAQFAESRAAWTWEVQAMSRQRDDLVAQHWQLTEQLRQASVREAELIRDRADLQRDRDELRQHAEQLQQQLNPYRRVDPLGLVRSGYGWAQRLKRSLVPGRA